MHWEPIQGPGLTLPSERAKNSDAKSSSVDVADLVDDDDDDDDGDDDDDAHDDDDDDDHGGGGGDGGGGGGRGGGDANGFGYGNVAWVKMKMRKEMGGPNSQCNGRSSARQSLAGEKGKFP